MTENPRKHRRRTLDHHQDRITQLLSETQSKTLTAGMLDCSYSTLDRYLTEHPQLIPVGFVMRKRPRRELSPSGEKTPRRPGHRYYIMPSRDRITRMLEKKPLLDIAYDLDVPLSALEEYLAPTPTAARS